VSEVHAGGTTGTTNLHHNQLIDILGIDRELSDRSKKGLKWCYEKYKGFNAAVQTMDQLSKQGKWPSGVMKPNQTELIEIFMSKSYWHAYVVKTFALVAPHPQMVAWLEDDSDGLSDFDVWHKQKSEYGFKELKDWLRNDGTLDKLAKGKLEKSKREKGKRGKGKGKGKGKETQVDEGGKGKEKEREIDTDDTDSGKGKVSTRIHKRK
jgi:hypothetical protein